MTDEMDKKTVLITDLDGTLYNWVDFFAPSFRAMVHAVGKETGISEDDVTESFHCVYLKHRSLEYPFAIQELDILKGLSPEELEKVTRSGRGAFRRTRSKLLKLHPGVRETLQWAKDEEIQIIGMTDTEFFQANSRLRFLRIDHFFHYLICRHRFELPDYALEKKMRSFRVRTEELYISDLKPEPVAFDLIVQRLDLIRELTYMVGDSLWKDVQLAQRVAVKDIWARYGMVAGERNRETIRRITTRSVEEAMKSEEAVRNVNPTYIIDNFSEIKTIIGSRKLRLF